MPEEPEIVSLEIIGEIAVVSLNSTNRPPVAAIAQKMRAALLAIFQDIDKRNDLKAAVLIYDSHANMAGPNFNELAAVNGDPHDHAVYQVIENCSKIVVAVLPETALGGVLEGALACHYRCASVDARLGFTELSLGIIPGAGGSQRLPRLIGAKAAVEMIFGMVPIRSEKALDLGLIDYVLDGDVRSAALCYAAERVAANSNLRKSSELTVDLSGYDAGFLKAMRSLAGKRLRGQNTPELFLESIDNAINLPFADGMRLERNIVETARASQQSQGLHHLYFAEKEIAKIPALPKTLEPLLIKSVGILGSGTMGTGISMPFADAGYDVTLFDLSADALERGLARIAKTYTQSVAKGRLSETQKSERFGRIKGATNMASLRDADLIIEAVFEDRELKKQVFAELDGICRPGAILASNTSTLDINELAAMTNRPENVIGLHFFSPANIMKLLEIVRAEKTSMPVLATAIDIARKIEKVGVVVGIGSLYGFVGNRMLIMGYVREADQMLLEGAAPEQIDRAIFDFGLPMGPWAMNDMAGVDVMGKILETTGATAANPEPFFNITRALASLGRAGQKTGRGFYRYEAGDRSPHHDPLVDEIIKQEAEKLNITPRDFTDKEIQQRCIYGLINEGAKILAEEIVYRAADIDVIWTAGYGFPRYKGGPMFYADSVGVKSVYETICQYHDQFGDYWTPAPLLERIAKAGTGLLDWTPEK